MLDGMVSFLQGCDVYAPYMPLGNFHTFFF